MIEPCREETHSIKNGLLTSHGNTWCIKNVYNWVEQPCCSSPYIYRTLRLSPRALLFRSPLCFCTVLCIPLSVCGHRCLWYLFLVATAREISQLFHNKGKPISIIKLTCYTWINITIEIFNTGFSLVNRHCGLPIRIGLMQLKGFTQTITLEKKERKREMVKNVPCKWELWANRVHRQGGNQSIGRERVKTELPGCRIASSEHELHPSPEDNPKHCLFIQKKKETVTLCISTIT